MFRHVVGLEEVRSKERTIEVCRLVDQARRNGVGQVELDKGVHGYPHGDRPKGSRGLQGHRSSDEQDEGCLESFCDYFSELEAQPGSEFLKSQNWVTKTPDLDPQRVMQGR